MPAVTTEGIILKRTNFGEADRVLTVLSDRYGKITVIARGVRKITSRRAGNVELLNRVKLHLFKGKGYTLTEAESIDTFEALKQNLTLSTIAFHIIEMVDRLTSENQKNTAIYYLTLQTLVVLTENPRQIFIRAFEVKILTLSGFWSISQAHDINLEIKNLLLDLEQKDFPEIAQIELTRDQALSLERVLQYYIEKVLEGPLKSLSVIKQLKQ
jgi:DNA repair protein RecO